MSRKDLVRPWSAHCRYTDKEPFYLGTVVLPLSSQQHDIEAALNALWLSVSPHAPPKMQAVPGAVFFSPEVIQ